MKVTMRSDKCMNRRWLLSWDGWWGEVNTMVMVMRWLANTKSVQWLFWEEQVDEVGMQWSDGSEMSNRWDWWDDDENSQFQRLHGERQLVKVGMDLWKRSLNSSRATIVKNATHRTATELIVSMSIREMAMESRPNKMTASVKMRE